MANPIVEFKNGLTIYLEGLRWLKAHPKYFGILFIPMLLGAGFLIGGLSIFVSYDETVLSWILFSKPEAWYGIVAYWISYGLLYVASLVVILISSLLLMNVIASPFYEVVSVAVERQVRGTAGEDLSIFQNLGIMLVELKKVTLIIGISVLLLFIPVINVISTLITAFLIGWDFFDFPIARRKIGFRERLSIVASNFWSVLGMGLWLVIPFVQYFMIPPAVVGGTLLGLKALDNQGKTI